MKELANPNNMCELKECKTLLEHFFEFIEAIEDLRAMAATYSAVNNLVEFDDESHGLCYAPWIDTWRPSRLTPRITVQRWMVCYYLDGLT